MIKKILVCKLRHHGDVLLSTPVFDALKKEYPGAHIDAYIYQETKPMLEGVADGFISYDKQWKKMGVRKFLYELMLLWKIRTSKYDLVINLTEGDRGALAARISKAKMRVGIDPQGSGMWGKSKCYTHISKTCPFPRHTVERNLDVLRTIGIFPSEEERALTFHIPGSAREKIQKLVPESFVLFHPVSRWLFKCYPPAKVAKLIRTLHERGERIVLTSSPDKKELQMLSQIELLCPNIPIINLGGKISLKELGALIDKSKLLVTVDSVPMHIASALKAPVVAIFGPTSEINWAPYRNPHARVVAKNMSCRPCFRPGCADSGRSDCLETLPVEDVLKSIDELYAITRVW